MSANINLSLNHLEKIPKFEDKCRILAVKKQFQDMINSTEENFAQKLDISTNLGSGMKDAAFLVPMFTWSQHGKNMAVNNNILTTTTNGAWLMIQQPLSKVCRIDLKITANTIWEQFGLCRNDQYAWVSSGDYPAGDDVIDYFNSAAGRVKSRNAGQKATQSPYVFSVQYINAKVTFLLNNQPIHNFSISAENTNCYLFVEARYQATTVEIL